MASRVGMAGRAKSTSTTTSVSVLSASRAQTVRQVCRHVCQHVCHNLGILSTHSSFYLQHDAD